MKINGREISLFEDEVDTNETIYRYMVILQELNYYRMPPLNGIIKQKFSDRYRIDVSEEEIEELREYCETTYKYEIPNQLKEDYKSGAIKVINPQDQKHFKDIEIE